MTVFLMVGVVDMVEYSYTNVEITRADSTVIRVTFPVELFPCTVSEGDIFYFENIDDVTEIRCGEPPIIAPTTVNKTRI